MDDISALSFEAAFEELENIVAKLESGELPSTMANSPARIRTGVNGSRSHHT